MKKGKIFTNKKFRRKIMLDTFCFWDGKDKSSFDFDSEKNIDDFIYYCMQYSHDKLAQCLNMQIEFWPEKYKKIMSKITAEFKSLDDYFNYPVELKSYNSRYLLLNLCKRHNYDVFQLALEYLTKKTNKESKEIIAEILEVEKQIWTIIKSHLRWINNKTDYILFCDRLPVSMRDEEISNSIENYLMFYGFDFKNLAFSIQYKALDKYSYQGNDFVKKYYNYPDIIRWLEWNKSIHVNYGFLNVFFEYKTFSFDNFYYSDEIKKEVIIQYYKYLDPESIQLSPEELKRAKCTPQFVKTLKGYPVNWEYIEQVNIYLSEKENKYVKFRSFDDMWEAIIRHEYIPTIYDWKELNIPEKYIYRITLSYPNYFFERKLPLSYFNETDRIDFVKNYLCELIQKKYINSLNDIEVTNRTEILSFKSKYRGATNIREAVYLLKLKISDLNTDFLKIYYKKHTINQIQNLGYGFIEIDSTLIYVEEHYISEHFMAGFDGVNTILKGGHFVKGRWCITINYRKDNITTTEIVEKKQFNWFVLALVKHFGLTRKKVTKSLQKVQLWGYFDVNLIQEHGSYKIYSRSLMGKIFDYCITKGDYTYHQPERKGLVKMIELKISNGGVMPSLFTYAWARKQGFCRSGILNFCHDFKLNPSSSYTILEIQKAVDRWPNYTYKYTVELRRMGVK